jgi:dihydrofolate reductase
LKLAIIAAVARNRGIGKDGRLPWRLPEDLRRFKELTRGHTVLMGRRTYESIGRPLSGRRNVVVSSRPISGVESYVSVETALAALADDRKVFVIGGAQLYRELLPRADEVYLTFVNREVDADTFFPPYEDLLRTRFREVRRVDGVGCSFVEYVRNTS